MQSAWTMYPDPLRATLRGVVTVAGPVETTVSDVAHALALALPWGRVGTSIFPEETLPLDLLDPAEAELEIGALVILTDANQGAPEYEDGSPEPSVSDVRIRFEQPVSRDLADRPLLLGRRRDLRAAFSRLHGRIGAA